MAKIYFVEGLEKRVNELKEKVEEKKSEIREIQQDLKCHQRALDALRSNPSNRSKNKPKFEAKKIRV